MKKQAGVTLIGFIFFAIAICVLGLLAMRIAPVYINHYRVVHAAKSLRSLPKSVLSQSPIMVASTLRNKLTSQLYVNGIKSVKAKNIKIKYKSNKYSVMVNYEVKKPLFYNMTLLFDFNTKVDIHSD